MPRNGSGVYGAPAGTTAVPNEVIESAPYNAFVADVAQALTDSINVDGTAPWQANQAMGTFKFTGLGAGSAATDSIQLGQAQSGIVSHAASVGGTADAITATFSPVFTAYTAKMRFRFTAGGANTITNPTINVDTLGAKTIKKLHSQALAAGDISGSGHVCDCVYDGTDVLLLNPAAVSTPTSVGKHTIWVPASAMISRTTNGAGSSTTETSSNDVMLETRDFDQTTSEGVQFQIGMPKGWNEGTVTFIPYWTASGGSAAQTCIFSMRAVAISDDDVLDAAFGTGQTSSDALIATTDLHIGPESSAITIGGTPAQGDMVVFEVSRDVSDTLAADAKLIGVKVLYTTDAATDA